MDLTTQRGQVMDRVNRALDAAWPARTDDAYVREMRSAAVEIEDIAAKLQAAGADMVEQSRTYNYLGTIYADLEPAFGKDWLLKAKAAYQRAEALLEGCLDPLERAKLDFNFGNTLRLIDANNTPQLQEAERRFLSARKVFTELAPQYLPNVDEGLRSVGMLLKIAPGVNSVDDNIAEMNDLTQQIENGSNLSEIIPKITEVMQREGGAAGQIGRTMAILANLPADMKETNRYREIKKTLDGLAKMATTGNKMDKQEEKIIGALSNRVETELKNNRITVDRKSSIEGILDEVSSILSGDQDDVKALLKQKQQLQGLIDRQFELAHYLSHGIPRPPQLTRAAELVEISWSLRRYLLEEMNRSGKGPDESTETLELTKRASEVDRRIYEAGADDERAVTIDREELRPLALAVRSFSARIHPMTAMPIWSLEKVPVDTTAVYYTGADDLRRHVVNVCSPIGLKLMRKSKGESIALSRWRQLQKAMIAVFDFSVAKGPELAAVAYETGIALTIGKPFVILTRPDRALPFDVDVEPVVISGTKKDRGRLAEAINNALVWTYKRQLSNAFITTKDHVLAKYPRPQANTYLDQTLRLLADQGQEPDALTTDRVLEKIVDYLDDGKTTLLHPVWSPVYPDSEKPCLFHVMPYKPEWSKDAAKTVRQSCEAQGVHYRRGDQVDDPNVIRSIWEEIARATHIVVDLTDFNANVALELGIAHTLGRPALLVGQGDTADRLFPTIAKRRVEKYDELTELAAFVLDFIG